MIIFYNRKTGQIVGTISGRINSKEEFGMWIGDKSENGRIICQWKPTKIYKAEDGSVNVSDFVPDHPQPEILKEAGKDGMSIYKHRIDLKTKRFVELKE